jgi:hypothetical protein
VLSSRTSGPFHDPEQLREELREIGASPEEIADLLPALQRLSEWQAPQPDPAETQRLLAWLAREVAELSPVRQALRDHRQNRISLLLRTARAQVSLLGIGFWLVSALITAIGAAVVLSKALHDEALVLGAGGPLLAYLGTTMAFRGRGARVLELELACLPSPLQLALARLVIVLGYDVVLGLALSIVFWATASDQALVLTLSWLMPLLLVAGLALVLSLRISVQAAASVAYASWLAVLAVTTGANVRTLLLAPELAVLGCTGLGLLLIALLRLRVDAHRLLPQG